MVDYISRQAAIDAMEQAKEQYFDRKVIIKKMQDIVNNLPSAQAEERTEERTETHTCDCISRQAAIDALDKEYRYGADIDRCGLTAALDEIEALPAADVAPVVHGEWEDKEVIHKRCIEEWQSARCSACGKYHTTPYMYYFDDFKFCPNCGAKMYREE